MAGLKHDALIARLANNAIAPDRYAVKASPMRRQRFGLSS